MKKRESIWLVVKLLTYTYRFPRNTKHNDIKTIMWRINTCIGIVSVALALRYNLDVITIMYFNYNYNYVNFFELQLQLQLQNFSMINYNYVQNVINCN